MEGEAKSNNIGLQSLLEAIKSAEVLENRISLISQLGDSNHSGASSVVLLVECLITYWLDSTGLNISQCMLNKTILHVATKYLESDAAFCLSQFLILGTKASIWCGKHLQMITMPNEESQELLTIFSQLVFDTLSFSSTCISALTKAPILGEKVVMLIIENFIYELLNLTKASILEIKKVHTIESEVLKVAQMVLGASIKLCRAYFLAIRSDPNEINAHRKERLPDDGVDYARHVIHITACTIENLYELGIFAASGGGNLVTVLNVSWKGVVSLLQLGKGVLTEKVNVGNIILTLVSLATESLRCAAEAWSSPLMETLAISEAKRTFLPIKFYLINAVRVSSDYSCEAMNMHRDITRCVLLISSLGISLCKEAYLKAACEVVTEFLEPTSFLLLHTLLNSADVRPESKSQILDGLFAYEINTDAVHLEEDIEMYEKSNLSDIFFVNCDTMLGSETLMLGRVILFLNLLKTSSVLREDIVVEISRKLDYLMNFLMHKCIYSATLGLWIPVLSGSGEAPEVVWQPLFSFILHALKTFIIVASSSIMAWTEVETFLLQNIFHSNFICLEIIRELYCFYIRHAETDTVNCILDELCLLLKFVASSEPSLMPLCALRNMARSICILLSSSAVDTVDHVYNSILNDDKSHLSSLIYLALLIEGFPLDSLSEKLKTQATRKILYAFYGFIDSNAEELELYSSGSKFPDVVGIPVHALSSAIRSCQIKISDIVDAKNISQILKFMHSVINKFKDAKGSMKEHCVKLLGATLYIISTTEHMYGSDEVGEVILDLKTLFVAGSADSDALLYQCKPSLASFMAGLCHMEIEESDGGALSSAIWDLYHVLLREKHWAFIHLAIAAFGYFAARTSCTQLWRFVPNDAALSFDKPTGKEVNEDRFMSELKGFLEKEVALREVAASKAQLSLLFKEGMELKKLCKISNTIKDAPEAETKLFNTTQKVYPLETVEVNDENCTKKKKRKLPDGICEGMEMLQNGLQTISKALAQAASTELSEAFSTHTSCIEDAIAHLVSLSDSV